MTPVQSSSLESIGYDHRTRQLTVKFRNGGVYHYENVAPQHHARLMGAESVGRYFMEHIRGSHRAKKADA